MRVGGGGPYFRPSPPTRIGVPPTPSRRPACSGGALRGTRCAHLAPSQGTALPFRRASPDALDRPGIDGPCQTPPGDGAMAADGLRFVRLYRQPAHCRHRRPGRRDQGLRSGRGPLHANPWNASSMRNGYRSGVARHVGNAEELRFAQSPFSLEDRTVGTDVTFARDGAAATGPAPGTYGRPVREVRRRTPRKGVTKRRCRRSFGAKESPAPCRSLGTPGQRSGGHDEKSPDRLRTH